MQAKQIDSKDNCSVCGGTHYGSRECPILAGLKQRCISKFCEEEIPIFRQGEPEHELEDFVTAEDCKYWVAEIKQLRTALSMDAPWPLPDVLAKLIEAVEHLLLVHSCDTHGHEAYLVAIECGKASLVNLRAGLASRPS